MPTAIVFLVEGRTPEQKKRLGEKITEAFVDTLGVPRSAIHVVFNDVLYGDYLVAGEVAGKKPEKSGR